MPSMSMIPLFFLFWRMYVTAADYLVSWAHNNWMMINEDIPPLCINGNDIERVTTFKLLGVFVSSDLSSDYHVMYLLRKVAKWMYCINYLFRAGVPASDIVCVYTSIIRSVLEYACLVWHPGLTEKTVKRYWVCTKTLFKNVVSGPFIYRVNT